MRDVEKQLTSPSSNMFSEALLPAADRFIEDSLAKFVEWYGLMRSADPDHPLDELPQNITSLLTGSIFSFLQSQPRILISLSFCRLFLLCSSCSVLRPFQLIFP